MTQQQLRELVKASNPVSAPERLLPQEQDVRTLFERVMHGAGNPQPSADLLEPPVERRRDMQTQEKPVRAVETPRPIRSKRRLLPALAGAMVVIAAAAGIWVLVGGNSDTASPIEVGQALDEATRAGDWEAVRALFADEATFLTEATSADGGPAPFDLPPVRPFADPTGSGGAYFATGGSFDWDGDIQLTGFDHLANQTMVSWAMGISSHDVCSQPDATTLVCERVFSGNPFPADPSLVLEVSLVYTVEDGLITGLVEQVRGIENTHFDPDLVAEYQDWVRANRPGRNPDDVLFDRLAEMSITPDTAEVHRQLIAEWQTQR